MTNPPTDERREFEAWAVDVGYNVSRTDDGNGYKSIETHNSRNAWNAALSHQGEVVKVSELRELQAYYVSWNYQEFEPCEQHDSANGTVVLMLSDLTALISKAEKV